MNPFRRFGIDKGKESDGVWFVLEDGVRIKIARLNTPVFNEKRDYLVRKKKTELESLNLPDSAAEEIIKQCLAESVVKGWEGFDDDEGRPMPCTPDNVLQLLEMQDFYDFVLTRAGNNDNFRAKLEEAELKNS